MIDMSAICPELLAAVADVGESGDLPDLPHRIAGILMRHFRSLECCFCPRNPWEEKALVFSRKDLSSCRLEARGFEKQKQCFVNMRGYTAGSPSKDFIVPCDVLFDGKPVLRLPVSSHFPISDYESGRVEPKEQDMTAVSACFCLPFKEELPTAEIEGLVRSLSCAMNYLTAQRHQDAWNRLLTFILREQSDNAVSDIYGKAIEALCESFAPVLYGCVLMHTETASLKNEEEEQSYLIPQKHHIFHSEFWSDETSKEDRVAALSEVSFLSMSETKYSVVRWANMWKDRYGGDSEEEFEYVLLPKSMLKFKTTFLTELSYSYGVLFPILRPVAQVESARNEDRARFRGVVLLIVPRGCHDLSFFTKRYLSLYSHAISCTIGASLNYTINEKIYRELRGQSHLKLVDKSGPDALSSIRKDVLNVDYFEIRELDDEGQLSPEPIHSSGSTSSREPEWSANMKRGRLEPSTISRSAFDVTEGGRSILREPVRGPRAGRKDKAVIICVNRRSPTNQQHIVPFRREDLTLAHHVGDYLMTLDAAFRDQEDAVTMSRVLNHEITGILDVMIKRVPRIRSFVPPSQYPTAQKEIDYGFVNLQDSIDLLNNCVIWPKILSGSYQLQRTDVSVTAIMKRWRNYYQEKRIDNYLTVDIQEPRPHARKVRADEALLEYAVSNLIRNALVYAHRGSKVVLTVRLSNDYLLIEVSDYGIGIQEEDLRRVFDLFFRSEEAKQRTARGEGQGAGLYVVKACIGGHGWPLVYPGAEEVCRFHAPLLFWLDTNKAWNRIEDTFLRREAMEVWHQQGAEIREKIARQDFRSSRWNQPVLNKALTRKTYKVTFTIKIPKKDWCDAAKNTR